MYYCNIPQGAYIRYKFIWKVNFLSILEYVATFLSLYYKPM